MFAPSFPLPYPSCLISSSNSCQNPFHLYTHLYGCSPSMKYSIPIMLFSLFLIGSTPNAQQVFPSLSRAGIFITIAVFVISFRQVELWSFFLLISADSYFLIQYVLASAPPSFPLRHCPESKSITNDHNLLLCLMSSDTSILIIDFILITRQWRKSIIAVHDRPWQ